MKNLIARTHLALNNDQKGATAIEYSMIAALVAVAIIGGFTLLGNEITGTINDIANTISTNS